VNANVSRLETREPRGGYVPPRGGPRLLSVGTANPPRWYSQQEVLDLFGEKDPKICSIFTGGHIDGRYLYLPEPVDGKLPEETSQQLIDKHRRGALEIGPKAIQNCLGPLGITPRDIDFLCCLSTTGFLCPGISALISRAMGFREDVRRADILGMGCNAGVNGLHAVTSYARAHPGRLALLLCVEICSAAYVPRRTITVAVVNSLFGDGAAAVLVRDDPGDRCGPIVADFESQIVVEALDAMRYDLDRDIPYLIGSHVHKPVNRLLARHGMKRRHIDHWLVHSGGKKVIDAIEYNIGLTDHDMRHTLHVLRRCGNLSSGSFLFSYQELFREGVVRPGDVGVVIAMGPGTSIETALLSWE
jgi:alkylresorcinol/alkylpyrone synthase/polyketide synthase Type III